MPDYDAIVLSGALPVFAEIDDTFDIDPDDIERHITPRTKVIIAAHLEGCPCKLDQVLEVARKHNIRVLEDCAQCCGGKYKGKYVGTIGDIGINSFQLSKTITSGEGGAVVTNDPELYERAFRFHDVGVASRAFNEEIGNGMLAGFRFVQLPYERVHRGRSAGPTPETGDHPCHASRQCQKGPRRALPTCRGLKLRESGDIEGDLGMRVFLDMANRQQRDQFLRAIRAEGISAAGPGGSAILPIATRIETKATIHPDWPSFSSPRGREIQYGAACCPRTIDIIDRYAGVRMGPKYTDQDVADIIAAIRKVYSAMQPA